MQNAVRYVGVELDCFMVVIERKTPPRLAREDYCNPIASLWPKVAIFPIPKRPVPKMYDEFLHDIFRQKKMENSLLIFSEHFFPSAKKWKN